MPLHREDLANTTAGLQRRRDDIRDQATSGSHESFGLPRLETPRASLFASESNRRHIPDAEGRPWKQPTKNRPIADRPQEGHPQVPNEQVGVQLESLLAYSMVCSGLGE